jgi:uncharacterized repeat protein (TIGR01451 family)
MFLDRPRVVRVFFCLLILSFVTGSAARAAERIELVSRVPPELVSDTGGSQSTFPATGARQTVSADGRYVVFSSSSTNLAPGQVDDNGSTDIFLYDRVLDTMRLVSHSLAGAAVTANNLSFGPSISADGRYVAFYSSASNIAGGDFNNTDDVFVFDRDTGTNTLVSHAAGVPSSAAGSSSFSPMISADGNWVAFVSLANNLMPGQVPDPFGSNEVFLWSRATNTSTMISHAATSTTTGADNGSREPVLSADGSWVAYLSFSSNLAAGTTDFNQKWDAYLWQRSTNTSRLVSRSGVSAATAGNGTVQNVRISADGSQVLFLSDGTDYLAAQTDTNTGLDAFLWSRATGGIALASRSAASATTTGNGVVFDAAALSADGNWVAFTSSATNLVTGQSDTNGTEDIFLWSRAGDATELVSRREGTTTTTSASTSNSTIYNLDISADGALVAYITRATQLVAGQTDANGLADLFVYRRATGTNALVSGSGGSATVASDGGCRVPVFSANGRWVGFYTTSSDIVPGVLDTNSSEDVLLYDSSTGAATLVSRRDAAAPSDTAGGPSIVPQILGLGAGPTPLAAVSADGRYLVFQSASDRLISGQADRNLSGYDVFLYDRQAGVTTLVSRAHGTATTTGNSTSQLPVISADGRWVAFISRASNLVAGQLDTTTTDDIFLWDRQTGAMTLVSHTATNLAVAAGGVSSPVISADGSWIAYVSTATNLVAGQSDILSSSLDVFHWSRATGANAVVSHRSTGLTLTIGGSEPWISADGRFVAFLSLSSFVVAGQVDSNSVNDLFLWDRTTGGVILVSSGTASALTAVGASAPAMSADGNWIAFSSTSNAVISGVTDTNSQNDLFLWERATGAKRLMSRTAASATTAGNSFSLGVMLSADGSRAAFLSRATNLVSGTDTNSNHDVFVFDRTTGLVALASHTPASAAAAGNGAAIRVAISADGSLATFVSGASNLVSGQIDTAGSNDLFQYDLATGAVTLLSRGLSSAFTAAGSGEGGFSSSDGSVVAFSGFSNKIVPNDHNGTSDVFLWIDESGTDLAIAKTDGVASVIPGQAVTYTITATNSGPTSTGATVVDTFPAALQGATWTCAAGGGASCAASGAGSLSQAVNLPVNGTVTFLVTGLVAADATGELANTATITPTGGVTDPSLTNNAATDSDMLTPLADLAVSMVDTPDPVGRGAALTWLVSVTNAGPSAAASVTVVDTLPAGTTFTGASGDGWSCGASGGVVTCTRPSLAPGSAPALSIQATAPVERGLATLPNTVAVTAATPDPAAANNGAGTETSVPQPGITVTPVSGLTTTEAGGTAAFTVVLDTAPLADVLIGLASSDTAEGTVSPASLTFTTGDWSMPRTVTVTGVNDDYDDGSVAFAIATGAAVSTDAGYAGIDPADVAVANEDDDTAGIAVTPAGGLTTTEAGGTATFTVVLQARPRADVTIALASDDTDEGTVEPASLTFTTDTWSTPQAVTVTGVDDDYDDGDAEYTVTLGAAVSTDAAWAGINPADVEVSNEDDDTAGIVVTPTEGLFTTEGGGTATFTVSLAARPAAAVTISLESSDPGEGLPDFDLLTFTPGSWDPQTVTVTGQDDDLRDGDAPYTLVLHPAESGDAAFDGLDPADVAVVNRDDSYEGVFYTIAPCRVVDTQEPGFGPALQNNQVAVVNVYGACGIPPSARAVSMNLTFTGAGQPGTVVVYPGDLAQPPVDEYLWIRAGNFPRSLWTIMQLGVDGTLAVLPRLKAPQLNPTVHISLDVTGYFE